MFYVAADASDRAVILGVTSAVIVLLTFPAILQSLLRRRLITLLHHFSTIMTSIYLLSRILLPTATEWGGWTESESISSFRWGVCRIDAIVFSIGFTIWHSTMLVCVFATVFDIFGSRDVCPDTRVPNRTTKADDHVNVAPPRNDSQPTVITQSSSVFDMYYSCTRVLCVLLYLVVVLVGAVVPSTLLPCPDPVIYLLPESVTPLKNADIVNSTTLNSTLPNPMAWNAVTDVGMGVPAVARNLVAPAMIATYVLFCIHLFVLWPLAMRLLRRKKRATESVAKQRSFFTMCVAFYASSTSILVGLILLAVDTARHKAASHEHPAASVTQHQAIENGIHSVPRTLAMTGITLVTLGWTLGFIIGVDGEWALCPAWKWFIECIHKSKQTDPKKRKTSLTPHSDDGDDENHLSGQPTTLHARRGGRRSMFLSPTWVSRHRSNTSHLEAGGSTTCGVEETLPVSVSPGLTTSHTTASVVERSAFRRALATEYPDFVEYCRSRHCIEYPLFHMHATALRNRWKQLFRHHQRRHYSVSTSGGFDNEDDDDAYASTDYPTSSDEASEHTAPIDAQTRMLLDKIYDTFLVPNAPMELNLNPHALNKVRAAWKGHGAKRRSPDIVADWETADEDVREVSDAIWRRRLCVVTGAVLKDVRNDLFVGVWPDYLRWRRKKHRKSAPR